VDFSYDSFITQLEEVEVVERTRTEIEEIAATSLHGNAQVRLIPDSVGIAGKMAIDLIAQAPGVVMDDGMPKIRGLTGINNNLDRPTQAARRDPFETMPSPNMPLIFVDGSEVNLGFLENIYASDVLYIDVLRGIEAAIYGLRGYNGVIVIATKSRLSKRGSPSNVPRLQETIVPGFFEAREFFSPDYAFEKPDHNRLDYRTTLFWQPNIAIEDSNRPPIQFYTGDTTGNYMIKVEGITRDGRAVVGQKAFEVQN